MASAAVIIRRRKRRIERKAIRETTRTLWTTIFGVIFFGLVILPSGIVLGGAGAIYMEAAARLPTPQDALFADDIIDTTTFYDSRGETVIHTVQDPLGERRVWVSLESLPAYVIDATLLVEDPDFWTTTSFDPLGMVVRLWHNLLVGPPPPDPSISGRLVRNVVAPLPDLMAGESVTDQRAREIALVSEVNRRYSLEEILEWHLNTNYYGSEAYGIEAAAQIYLGKPAAQLTLDEAALLASIPTATQYNPFDNIVAAQGRQRDTLRSLLAAGKINDAAYTEATSVETAVLPGSQYRPPLAPDFVLYSRQQAEIILDSLGRDGARLVARGGLRIVTTLDLDLYNQASCTLETQLARLNRTLPPTACTGAAYLPSEAVTAAAAPDRGAVVVIDARTGEIKAMIGAAGAAAYQPGPILQPFVYFEGFNGGSGGLVTPASMVLDIPNEFPGSEDGLIYVVRSPDGRYRGPINLRDAMGAGLLPPTAEIAYRQGMSTILRTAHQLGLNSLNETDYDLMLLERGGAVAPLDVGYAYSVFAGLGKMRGVPTEPVARGYRARDPVAIQRIEDARGNVLWQYDRALATNCNTLDFCTPLMETGLAYLINDVLADQETRWELLGQDNVLELSRPGAVVNGLTADRMDNWTAGYTPQYVTVVHLERGDGGAMELDTYGTSGAAAVWRAVMEYVHRRDTLPALAWERPERVVEALVCDRSGFAPNGVCPARTELFMEGTTPIQRDTHWQMFQINRQSGRLATATTLPELVSEARFFVPPDEAMDWWRETGQPLPPAEVDTIGRPERVSGTRIAAPLPFAYVGGEVEILGNIVTDNMQYFQLSYGESLNPSTWIDLGGQRTTFTEGEPLAVWDTRGLDGLYSLRLSVVLNDNSIQREVTQVTVDNTAPRVRLTTVEPNQVYRWPGDEVVVLSAEVEDNLTVDHVEFFHNGEYLGSDETRPYGFEWRITQPGTETFSAVAFDTVGNQSNSQITVQIPEVGVVILSDLSPPAIIDALQENLFAFAVSFSVLDNAELYRTADCLRMIVPGVENPFFNSVFRARLDLKQIDAQIEDALSIYRVHRRSAYWWVFSNTQPPDLGERLRARGLWAIRNEGLAADLDALNERIDIPPRLLIERVQDEATFETWLRLNTLVFGFSDALEREFWTAYTRLGFSPEAPLQHYIGYLDGKPVGTSSGMMSAGVIGIYNVGVVFTARGQGIGSAMTLYPLRLARAGGVRVGVLQATRMGYSVYRRLGFQDYTPVFMYLYTPP